MAGSISLSLSQQFDSLGNPLGGGKLYFYQAGTTATPQNAYQDSALTIAHPNPITLDAAGRVPAFYLADGFIKIRLTDKNGVQQIAADNILVIGPSSGGGGGGGVDPTTILATGDMKIVYGTGSITGFVRANGRSIGSATSGASERANADTQALYIFLWNADPNLAVSSGRGASGLADFQANKTIALPDLRGRVIAGLDSMGASPAGRLGSGAGSFGTTNDTLGAAGGNEIKTLTTSNLPPYTPAGTITNGAITFPNTPISSAAGGGNSVTVGPNSTGTDMTNTFRPQQAATTWSGTAQGGTSAPFDLTQPTMLATYYVKL